MATRQLPRAGAVRSAVCGFWIYLSLAGTDRQIRVALDTPDAGFAQVMAT